MLKFLRESVHAPVVWSPWWTSKQFRWFICWVVFIELKLTYWVVHPLFRTWSIQRLWHAWRSQQTELLPEPADAARILVCFMFEFHLNITFVPLHGASVWALFPLWFTDTNFWPISDFPLPCYSPSTYSYFWDCPMSDMYEDPARTSGTSGVPSSGFLLQHLERGKDQYIAIPLKFRHIRILAHQWNTWSRNIIRTETERQKLQRMLSQCGYHCSVFINFFTFSSQCSMFNLENK
jgi:hypothetical protein